MSLHTAHPGTEADPEPATAAVAQPLPTTVAQPGAPLPSFCDPMLGRVAGGLFVLAAAIALAAEGAVGSWDRAVAVAAAALLCGIVCLGLPWARLPAAAMH